MSFDCGKNLHITIFGQSHSDFIGVSLDGLPAGFDINLEKIRSFLSRRKTGVHIGSSSRIEEDKIVVLSGLVQGKTCGSPLCIAVENKNCRHEDYEKLENIPRPMHADFPALIKYNGMNDKSGGGHFSGRMTVPLCIAGAVCKQFLEKKNIFVGGHILSIGTELDSSFDPVNVNKEQLLRLAETRGTELAIINPAAGEKMKSLIGKISEAGDSAGGVVECCILGLPAGIGDTMFDSLEGQISRMLFAIPSVKGVEFGSGFNGAKMLGSNHNDAYYYDCEKNVRTRTNNHGGILGGLTTGMPVIFRCAFKPVPSIKLQQESVDLVSKLGTELVVTGRHDACIVTRVVPCVESAAWIVAMENMLSCGDIKWN